MEAAKDTKDWTVEAAKDTKDWTVEAAVDTKDWTVEAAVDTKDWTVEAAKDTVEFVQTLPDISVSVIDVDVNYNEIEQKIVVEDPSQIPSDQELE